MNKRSFKRRGRCATEACGESCMGLIAGRQGSLGQGAERGACESVREVARLQIGCFVRLLRLHISTRQHSPLAKLLNLSGPLIEPVEHVSKSAKGYGLWPKYCKGLTRLVPCGGLWMD